MFNRQEFKARAKAVLKRNYWTCFFVTLVLTLLGGSGSKASVNIKLDSAQEVNYFLDTFVDIVGLGGVKRFVDLTLISIPILLIMAIFSLIFSYFVLNVLEVGKKKFFLEARENRYEFKTIGFAFKHPGYLNVVKTMFFKELYIFLWSLLLFIPGVIASYRYRFIGYIIAENPEMDMRDVFDLSRAMTDGIKMDLFILDLSFLGWYLLNIVTFGLASYFINPYPEATDAEVYRAYQQKLNTTMY